MLLLGCVLSASLAAQGFLAGPVVKTEQVRAELLAHAPQGVQAGQTFWLGLQIAHQPHWHTYWQNPGDSGLPTQLRWTLPEGLQAGAIDWPLPKKIPIGSLANYGYEGTVLLRVPVQVAANAKLPAAPLSIQLQAEWLVCRQECIPQEGTFKLQLPAHSATALNSAPFEAAQKTQTTAHPGAHSTTLEDAGQTLAVRVQGLPSHWQGQTLSLFPVTPDVVKNAAVQGQGWTQQWQGPNWIARVPVSAERGSNPERMRWLLARGPEREPQAPGLELESAVQGPWPALSTPAAAPLPEALRQALQANAAAPQPSASALSLGLALLGALLGGLLLNLMPCVFPVLAIKVLGFTRPGSSAHAHRASGLAYTAGVVLSFVLLGALLMALRAAGEQLGWGFQLQSPWAVTALAVLFTLLGLNLVGLFEFGHLLPSAVMNLQSRHPTVDAALSGVLAVAIASPCTAPFMGASLGLAVGLPLWQALPVFAAMGLGMALPYLGASLWPALAQRLPRPGAWMQTFKQAMAFPMFATVVWLLWVLGQQTGIDGVSSLLAALLALAALVWALGLQGRARPLLSWVALAALVGTAAMPLRQALQEPAAASAPSSERWAVWSPAEVAARQAQGQTVFVDFTAAWCVTCQYNKKTTLADARVLAAFDAKNVQAMRADWTRRDAAITQALGQLGRSGVPVYVVYAPGKPPVVLSELPSVQDILSALP